MIEDYDVYHMNKKEFLLCLFKGDGNRMISVHSFKGIFIVFNFCFNTVNINLCYNIAVVWKKCEFIVLSSARGKIAFWINSSVGAGRC